MAQKTIYVPEVGEVILSKRRGSKNLRLSIRPDGIIRVSLPYWAPYSMAMDFVRNRAEWIRQNNNQSIRPKLEDGHRIGKSYRIKFINNPASERTYARLGINSITITSPLNLSDSTVQKQAVKVAERALRKETEKLLGARLEQLAAKHNLQIKGFKVKRLTGRWGSCSNHGQITLNYFLVQLPWHLIDYVIVHELAHTRHLNHSPEFWSLVNNMLPEAKIYRKEIKKYRPILLPS